MPIRNSVNIFTIVVGFLLLFCHNASAQTFLGFSQVTNAQNVHDCDFFLANVGRVTLQPKLLTHNLSIRLGFSSMQDENVFQILLTVTDSKGDMLCIQKGAKLGLFFSNDEMTTTDVYSLNIDSEDALRCPKHYKGRRYGENDTTDVQKLYIHTSPISMEGGLFEKLLSKKIDAVGIVGLGIGKWSGIGELEKAVVILNKDQKDVVQKVFRCLNDKKKKNESLKKLEKETNQNYKYYEMSYISTRFEFARELEDCPRFCKGVEDLEYAIVSLEREIAKLQALPFVLSEHIKKLEDAYYGELRRGNYYETSTAKEIKQEIAKIGNLEKNDTLFAKYIKKLEKGHDEMVKKKIRQLEGEIVRHRNEIIYLKRERPSCF